MEDLASAIDAIRTPLAEVLGGFGHGILSLTIVFGDDGDPLAVRVQTLPDDASELPTEALSRIGQVGCRAALRTRPLGRYVVEERLRY